MVTPPFDVDIIDVSKKRTCEFCSSQQLVKNVRTFNVGRCMIPYITKTIKITITLNII